MGIFGRGKGGGAMNVIRCDLQDYLIWKWRPLGQSLNTTSRENAIRYGSSLRVKEGEVAVFVYKQKDGTMMDFIMGPFDQTIKTANFPVLSSIVGLAYGGESPFQADIYFINLAGNIQMRFAVPYFDVADPRFLDFVVPVAASGTLTFNIADYKQFIKLNRMQNFSLDDLQKQIRDAVVRRVKNTITNAPAESGFPLVQIDRKIEEINEAVYTKLEKDFYNDFGVNLKRLDLARIDIDKDSEGWAQLRNVTAEQQQRLINVQSDLNIQNLMDTQRINTQNMEETMRIQREEMQRAQRLQTEQTYIGAHALNRQAEVLQTAAENLAAMGTMDMGGGGGGGLNPAGLMTGMAVGGAVGNQMAGMMNQMGAAMGGQMQGVAAPGMAQQPGMQGMPPMPGQQAPPPPQMPADWMLAINGQQSGPYSMQQLQQLVANGHLSTGTHVWRPGMAAWELAGNIPELAPLFAPTMPPSPATPPGMPPIPGMPPAP